MSSGSSGYDPKYTSFNPGARADGRRYHKAPQQLDESKEAGSKTNKIKKKSKEQSTSSKATPKLNDKPASTKVGPISCLDLSGMLTMATVKMHSVIGLTADNHIPFLCAFGIDMAVSATN